MKRLIYLTIFLCFIQINVIHASEHVQRQNDIVFINNTSVDSCHLSNRYEYIFIDELLKVRFDINVNEKAITREEFCNLAAYMLNQIYQENSTDYYVNVNLRYILEDMGLGSVQDVSFSDYEVPYPAVNDLYIMGIIKGKGENIFEPYEVITYEETAQLLYNIAKVFISKDIMNDTSSDYLTKSKVSDWAKEAVSWIVQNEIMVDSFEPELNMTREQAIISINRLYKF